MSDVITTILARYNIFEHFISVNLLRVCFKDITFWQKQDLTYFPLGEDDGILYNKNVFGRVDGLFVQDSDPRLSMIKT